MNIKVQCPCGAKFSFDVEPVNGQMPTTIACPTCGADATSLANEVLAKNISTPSTPAGLRVAAMAAPPKRAAPVVLPDTGTGQLCSRHPRRRVESHCFVCQKPICMECMQIFGYLCSATCRYQAEQQRINVPPCEFKHSVADTKNWNKIGAIIGLIVLFVVGLVGLWGWYTFSGSKPKVYFSYHAAKAGWITYSQFVDAQHVLVADEKQIALHDIDQKKVVWSHSFGNDSKVDISERPQIFLTPEHIWVCLDGSVLRLDRKKGDLVNTIAIKGVPTAIQFEKGELVVHSRGDDWKENVMRIDVATGNAKTDALALTPIEKTIKARDLSLAAPTQGVLLEQELNQPTVSGSERSQFISAGENIVELQVRMIEEHFTEVQAIKANKGPSKLNENVTAATPVAPVAEELFNDLARSRGSGGFKTVDESRYGITLKRNSKEIPEWHGEVTGPPGFFPQKTVDVLVGGKGIRIFDKQNKLLKEDKLAFPIAQEFTSSFAQGSPCFEADSTLYFFDRGVLAAYELPSGAVRWRVPSVGISSIQNDGKGGLYVCTTTASPEDIQYSEQIKMQDRITPVLMKVEAKSGKVLWKVNHLGVGCYLTDKFVYGSNQQISGGPALAVGLGQALGSMMGGTPRFRLSRLDPDTGKELWGYYKEGFPDRLDFSKNRILLQYEDRVVVLKFLTLF